jgi:hypothetical protein
VEIMNFAPRLPMVRAIQVSLVVALAVLALASDAFAQGRGRGGGGGAPGAAPTGRASAPRDFTGTWVSVVTEHWHLRMTMPPRRDYAMLPITPEARKIADAWDPARDVAEGNQCKAYGAASIMRIPGRVHIRWLDDNTLQLETDSGTQTRAFRFGGAAPAGEPQWQGYSVASWEGLGAARGRGRSANQLHVRTTNMRPGYLRKNGVPYSEKAVLDEYFDTFTEPNGDNWLVVTSIVTDPQYLTQPYATTYPFKKIPDRSGWDPTPCRVDEPR